MLQDRLNPPPLSHSSSKLEALTILQIEGAVAEGGRTPSIWDTYSATPGMTFGGDTGQVADDFYHRYPQDIVTVKGLGVQMFRLSISWTRIIPTGTGAVSIPQPVPFVQRFRCLLYNRTQNAGYLGKA